MGTLINKVLKRFGLALVSRADLQESLDEYNAPEANNRLRKALE